MPQRDSTYLTALEAWRLSPATRAWVGGNNTDARQEVERLIAGVPRPAEGDLDRGLVTPASADEALYFARKLRPRAAPDFSLWIVLPKRGSSKDALFTGAVEDLTVPMFELGYMEKGLADVGEHYVALGFTLDSRTL